MYKECFFNYYYASNSMQRSESVFNFIMRAYKSRYIKGYILSYKSKIMCNFMIKISRFNSIEQKMLR